MKLGISSYTYTWNIGVSGYEDSSCLNHFELLQKSTDQQVEVLQIADNLPLLKLSIEEQINLYKKANENKIELEAGSRLLTEENLNDYLAIANRIKSKILRFIIDGENYKPNLDKVIWIIKNNISSFEHSNIKLAIENHDRFLTKDFIQIINEVQSDYLGICLDCANSLGAGEGIFEVVNQLAPFTINLHLKDIIISRKKHMMGFDVEGCPFGKGLIPIEWVIKKMPSNCYSAILELWTPPEKDYKLTIYKENKWANESINFLRPYFN